MTSSVFLAGATNLAMATSRLAFIATLGLLVAYLVVRASR